MREILFRGKDISTGEWTYGSLDNCTFKDGKTTNAAIRTESFLCVLANPDSIGQAVGLNDMQGVPIYEGDILEDCHDDEKMHEQGTHYNAHGHRFVVEWHGNLACFYARPLGLHNSRSMSNAAATCKVVGNTTDNPLPKPKPTRYSAKRKKPL